MYVSLDEEGRIGATTEYEEYAEGMEEFTFPDDFDFTKQNEYRIQNGELVHVNPKPPSEEELSYSAQSLQREQEINVARLMVAKMITTLSDEEAESVSQFIPEWTVGESYAEDSIVRYRGSLYRLLKSMTAVAQYPPDVDTSTYKRIGEPNEDGIYPWSQPLGATDAYMKGEKVTYDGKTWVSDIDNNVWAPGVYGWSEVSSSTETPEPEDPDEPITPVYSEWVQPTGAHDAYQVGDIVSYNGKLYVSTAANNVWAPGVYGWSEYTE